MSPREIEIARLVAQAMPNKCIARVLDISPWTIAPHLRRIFGKLQITSRTELAIMIIGRQDERLPGAAPRNPSQRSDRRTRNSTHWYRQEFENLYGELMATINAEQRDEIKRRMQEIQYEDPPGVFLYQRPIIMGVTDQIQGYTPHPAMIVEDWRGIYVDETATN